MRRLHARRIDSKDRSPSVVPELTLVVPVWDSYVKWLPAFIEALPAYRQGADFGVIVVDNASEVPLPELPADVHLIRSSRRLTLGGARNMAIAVVKTELFCSIDVDDYFPAGYFAFCVERMRRRADLVACSVRPWRWYPESGERVVAPYPPPESFWLCRWRRLFGAYALATGPKLVMGGAVFRTTAVRRAGGYNDSNFQDDRHLSQVLPFIGPIEVHPGPGLWKRMHMESVMHRPVSQEEIERTYDVGLERCLTHPDIPRYLKILLKRRLVRRYREGLANGLREREERRSQLEERLSARSKGRLKPLATPGQTQELG